jgi:hypothetical protein
MRKTARQGGEPANKEAYLNIRDRRLETKPTMQAKSLYDFAVAGFIGS